MNWIKVPFYLYLLLKPYYIRESGGIQPADFFLAAALPLFFVFKPKSCLLTDFESRNLKAFALFTFYTVVVNLIYLIIYPGEDFYDTVLYYTFNFSGIVVFTFLIKDMNFLKRFYNIQTFNIIVQFLILIANRGRYLGGIRYMGTFNDPNQFSFYIFLGIIFTYVLEDLLARRKRRWIVYLMGTYLIASSASTGMLLGLSIFFLAVFVSEFKISRERLKSYSKFMLLILLLGGGVYSTSREEVNKKVTYLTSRIEEKISSTQGSSEVSLIEDRGYDKLYKNVKYLFLGSGEGDFSMARLEGYHRQEIHGTFPSFLLYYGIPGLLLVSFWLYRSLHRVPLNQLLVFMALFLESCTLAHQRQFLFWGVIILMSRVRKIKEPIKLRK